MSDQNVDRSQLGLYPLSGTRVLDLGWSWAGPLVGSILADMGAEVIKVESRKRLCITRRSIDNVTGDPEADPFFHSVNRNKLGIAVDISDPRGAAIIKRLAGISDIVVENFSPRVLKKHGLSYDHLCEVNPDIIMISLPATGHSGPLSDVVTWGPSLASLSGLDSMVGYYDERVLGMQQAYADPTAGLHGAFAVLAALWHRHRTGQGQHIELAQLELLVSCVGEAIMEYTMNGRVLGTQGNRSPDMVPHNNYPCRGQDKWVSIAVKTEDEWHNLCEVIGDPELSRDDRFASKSSRLRNQEELDKRIADWTRRLTHYEVTEQLQRRGVAATPCLDIEERYFDPHLQERETCIEMEHPAIAHDFIAGIPFKLSVTPAQIRMPAPLMGQHNAYIFKELLSIPQEELNQLAADKVIY